LARSRSSAARIVVLAQHFYIAAQGQNADAVFGFAPAEFAELEAVNVEAQIEFFAFHAA